jgi:hypothetical protein
MKGPRLLFLFFIVITLVVPTVAHEQEADSWCASKADADADLLQNPRFRALAGRIARNPERLAVKQLGRGRVVIFGAGSVLPGTWPTSKIVFILHPEAKYRADDVRWAANQISELTKVKLIEGKYEDAAKYKDHILLVNEPDCWAHVGYLGGIGGLWSQNKMGIAKCIRRGSIVHEFGHALGLAHEHERRNRSEYIDVKCENIIDNRRSDMGCGFGGLWERLKQLLLYKSLSDYDFSSVMHYSQSGASPTGQQSFELTEEGQQLFETQRKLWGDFSIGQRECLSKYDQMSINFLYRN